MVTYDEQYGQFKPIVENLFHTQERLCARLLSEAGELIKKLRPEEGSNPEDPAALEREIGLIFTA
jgi:NTP pyrophosphatase (non-canonical NTP hydrolase)